MITLETYLMGRDKEYPLERIQYINAANLLARVNYFLGMLRIKDVKMTSGYRPGKYNKIAGGSARSGHISCEAIDIADSDGSIGLLIMNNLDLMEECGLYLEHLDYTVKKDDSGKVLSKWIHLQTRKTQNRIFKPY